MKTNQEEIYHWMSSPEGELVLRMDVKEKEMRLSDINPVFDVNRLSMMNSADASLRSSNLHDANKVDSNGYDSSSGSNRLSNFRSSLFQKTNGSGRYSMSDVEVTGNENGAGSGNEEVTNYMDNPLQNDSSTSMDH